MLNRRGMLGAIAGAGILAAATGAARATTPGAPARAASERVKPRAMPNGGVVAVLAPASPAFRRSDILRGQAVWAGAGYRVRVDENVFWTDGYLAGAPEARAKALQAAFLDPDVDAIQVAGGGFGSTQLIPFLDFDAIRRHPKPFIGRSDITALHLALDRLAGLTTFYGPGLVSVAAPNGSKFTEEGLLRAMSQNAPLGTLPRHPADAFLLTVTEGRVTGELKGGCLWPMCKAIGTPWAPKLDGAILFIEEVDEPPWSIDAHLTHLLQAGLLNRVAGIVIGRMVNCDWSPERPEYPSNLSLDEVIQRRLGPLGVPCLYGIPVGHEQDTLTIPLGVTATLDATRQTLEVRETAFAD